MKISKKMQEELYRAIHSTIVDVRIKLKLTAKDDVTLAQVEHKIWSAQKQALGLSSEL